MLIGKEYTFDAAHFLKDHKKCGILHGHTYTVTVELEGNSLDKSDFVLDLHVLNKIMQEILTPLDHHTLNDTIFYPSCENIVRYIHAMLSRFPALENLYIKKVRVKEGGGGYAEE